VRATEPAVKRGRGFPRFAGAPSASCLFDKGVYMRICIPTKNEKGLEAEIHEHFGDAPAFTLIDTDSGEVEIVVNSHEGRGHGTCHPMHQLKPHALDAIVCKGVGRRAVELLREEGIDVMITTQARVLDILAAVRSGALEALTPAMACQGHGRHSREHRHQHGHRH
jgi:predicted Fe-Mo cluster-binding NifX family protein